MRHEAAEALGAIGTARANEVLREHAGDEEEIVRESCWVALMCGLSDHSVSRWIGGYWICPPVDLDLARPGEFAVREMRCVVYGTPRTESS